MKRQPLTPLLALALSVAGCGYDQGLAREQPYDPLQPLWSTDDGAGGGGPTNLPCDVQGLLVEQCTSCHGRPPTYGVPISLQTRDDLLALRGGQRAVDLSLRRMQDAKAPMPPGGLLAPAKIAILANWVKAGAPAGTCMPPVDPFNTPVKCTSNMRWTGGNREDERMHPGLACIACHTREGEGPQFDLAGTLYPSAHEPDDCNGAAGAPTGATVIITGADGKVITLAPNVNLRNTTRGPNAVGNFFYTGPLALPYRAKVVVGGKERLMNTAQRDGDCNGCHTLQGHNGAPGRIVIP